MQSKLGILSALLLGLGACTHEYTFATITPTPARLEQRRDRRVAIVMDERLIHSTYETSTDGHTFVFHGAAVLVERALEQALAGSVGAVQAVAAASTPGFDAQLFPELSIEATGMLNHHCTVRYALTVTDDRGQVLAKRRGESDETFVPIAGAAQACETALIAAFNAVTYQALAEGFRLR